MFSSIKSGIFPLNRGNSLPVSTLRKGPYESSSRTPISTKISGIFQEVASKEMEGIASRATTPTTASLSSIPECISPLEDSKSSSSPSSDQPSMHARFRRTSVKDAVLSYERRLSGSVSDSHAKSGASTPDSIGAIERPGFGFIILSIPNPPKISIPQKAKDRFTKYLIHNGITKFSQKQIDNAFKVFESECLCKWENVVRQKVEVLEVINLLRDSELEYLINRLKEMRKEADVGDLSSVQQSITTGEDEVRFPALTFIDCGSKYLDSDKDITFVMKKKNQHLEPCVVKEFNSLFETDWQASSSTVFATNAYTSYREEICLNPKNETSRIAVHTRMSYVMMLMNISKCHETELPEMWGLLKHSIYDIAKDSPVDLEDVFLEVEEYYKGLKILLDSEVVRIATGEDVTKANTKDIQRTAARILLFNSDWAVRAGNNLYNKFYNDQEKFQVAYSTLHRVFNVKKKGQFKENLSSAIDELIKISTYLIQEAKNPPIGKKINSAEIRRLNRKIEDLLKIKEDVEKLSVEQVEDFFQKNSEDPYIVFLKPFLEEECDLLLLEKQQIDMKARCFAQDMHISQGAFAFTVKDVQQGHLDSKSKKELIELQQRPKEEYLQALNELIGFYLHESHDIDNTTQLMLKKSKYIGQRFFSALDCITISAKKQGEQVPHFKYRNRLSKYFRGLYSLKTGVADDRVKDLLSFTPPLTMEDKSKIERKLRKELKIPKDRSTREVDVEKVNHELIHLLAEITVWCNKKNNI